MWLICAPENNCWVVLFVKFNTLIYIIIIINLL